MGSPINDFILELHINKVLGITSKDLYSSSAFGVAKWFWPVGPTFVSVSSSQTKMRSEKYIWVPWIFCKERMISRWPGTEDWDLRDSSTGQTLTLCRALWTGLWPFMNTLKVNREQEGALERAAWSPPQMASLNRVVPSGLSEWQGECGVQLVARCGLCQRWLWACSEFFAVQGPEKKSVIFMYR